jgi:uncharacterized membrane protein YphA (DoxX/SURF4 family)
LYQYAANIFKVLESRLQMKRVGVYVYGLATVAAGIMDLLWGDFDPSHQPIQAFGDHIPARTILSYITAFWMTTGGVAILWRRSARAGAAALAVIYFIFAVFWLPRFYTAPLVLGFRIPVLIGVLGGFGTQLIVSTAGALVYASLATRGSTWSRTVLIARWIFGVCSIAFGLGHLTDIKHNIVYVPTWMPLGREFWVIATGICFVLAGLALSAGILDVLAARLLALMLLIFSAVTLIPAIFAFPDRHEVWGGNAYQLAAVAAAWILADSNARRAAKREHDTETGLLRFYERNEWFNFHALTRCRKEAPLREAHDDRTRRF